MKTFGETFKETTDKAGHTLHRVAQELEVSDALVYLLRSNRQVPSLKIAEKIKKLYGIPCIGTKHCFQWPPERGK